MKENFYYKSPIGILKFTIKDDFLISLKIVDEYFEYEDTNSSKNIKKQLEEYFSKKRKKFDIKIKFDGTEFQKKVWNELSKIPHGKTVSYSTIAEKIGDKNAQRAVGTACNKNPIMIIIPCHRVIAKNKNISGFAYGIDIKQKLLEIELNNIFNSV